ncbi:MAG: exodeoxyribonuclease VII large subunit [Alistipes sp.]|nr:exodeoxyribonuclease VII large subunit [Alistipes sp.]
MEQRAYITLSQLQSRISIVVEDAFDRPIWVVAEIAELKLNRSGHCYLELVEKGEREAICASARGVIWRTGYQSLMRRFEAESGRTLAAGMKILAKIAVSYHPLYGLSLQIVDLDPTYTLGDIEQRKRETIERLQREGVWDMNRTLPLPRVVQRIAIVSSATAAGYRDFMREIEGRIYRIDTTLFEAVMQGEMAEQSIIEALSTIAERCDDFDAVAIIRGGGSTGDLDCYNGYELASFVAQFPLPILSGIGHDKDVSITDMVAAVPLKTPTAVAAWICDRAADFDGELERYAIALRDICRQATLSATLRLEHFSTEVRHLVERTLQSESQRLDGIANLVANFAPERIFRLGYAIARKEGESLQSVNSVSVGDTINISLADGEIESKITKIVEKQ